MNSAMIPTERSLICRELIEKHELTNPPRKIEIGSMLYFLF